VGKIGVSRGAHARARKLELTRIIVITRHALKAKFRGDVVKSVKQIKEGTTLHNGSSCSCEIAPLVGFFELTSTVSDVEHNLKMMRA
jgi:hypothetical protein